MHAWVLVKAGARGVPEDTLVEVTSGRQYKPSTAPYTGIEWVWNHENLWIAMDLPEPHSDARLHPARALFDFWDARRWEAVLPRPRPPPPADGIRGDSELGEVAGEVEAGEVAAATPASGASTLRSMTMSRHRSTAVLSDGDLACTVGGVLLWTGMRLASCGSCAFCAWSECLCGCVGHVQLYLKLTNECFRDHSHSTHIETRKPLAHLYNI